MSEPSNKSLEKKLDLLESKLKQLSTGFVPLGDKRFYTKLKESLQDVFQEEEKIKLIREIKSIGISVSIILIMLSLFIIWLILFTEPI